MVDGPTASRRNESKPDYAEEAESEKEEEEEETQPRKRKVRITYSQPR